MEREDFTAAMRLAASGVSVVTTKGSAGRAGVTVSAMCPVSADPPTLLACIHHLSPAADLILANGGFCVNIVSARQRAVAEWFAGLRRDPGVDKFACATWRDLGFHGLALEGALAAFDCRLLQSHRVGSHFIMIGSPAAIVRGEGLALIYSDRSFGVPHLQAERQGAAP